MEKTIANKYLPKLFLSVLIVLLLISFASSLEFDNVKYYDSGNRQVTIKNSFLGIATSDVATIKLNTPLVYTVIEGRDRKVAEFDIDLIGGSYNNALKQMELYNVLDGKVITRPITYKTKSVETYEVEVNDYKEICEESKEINKTTGKANLVCDNVVTGSHQEQREREVWTSLSKTDLTEGKVTIGIFTNVYDGDNVEWIPTMFGVRIEEFAKWTTVSSYLNFTFDDATNYSKQTGTYAMGISDILGSGVAAPSCIDGGCFKFESDSNAVSAQAQPNTYGGWSMWINRTSDSATGQIMGSTGVGSLFYQILWSGTTFRFYFNEAYGDTSVSRNYFAIGNWTHTYVKCNATGGYIFINGVKISSDLTQPAGSCKFFNGGNSFYFGIAGFNYTIMDEVKFFNTELSDVQIIDLYTTEKTGTGITQTLNVTLISPADNFVSSLKTLQFNCTYSNSSILTNISLWTNNTGIFNISKSVTSNGAEMPNTFLDYGKYIWGCQACNSTNDCIFTSSNRTIIIQSITNNSVIYNSPVTSLSAENYTFNISYSPTYTGISANLIYNGTTYPSTIISDGTNKIITNQINMPIVTSQQNKSFFFSVTLSNSSNTTNYNSSNYIQTINPLSIDNCSTNTYKILNYTLFDEDLNTIIPLTLSSSISYDIRISNPSSSSTFSQYSGNVSNVNSIQFCLPSSSNTSTYRLDSTVRYSTDGRVTRYNHIQNGVISPTTTQMNVTLRDLNTTNSQAFSITYTSSSFIPQVGYVLEVQRFYTNTNSNNLTIETAITDTSGTAQVYLTPNTIYYQIITKKDGVTKDIFNIQQAKCQVSPCTISISTSGGLIDIPTSPTDNLQLSNPSISSSAILSISFSETDGIARTIALLIYQQNNYLTQASLNSASGTLTMNLSAYQGETLLGYITEEGEIVAQFTIVVPTISAVDMTDSGKFTFIIMGAIFFIMFVIMAYTNNILMLVFEGLGIFILGALRVVTTGTIFKSTNLFLLVFLILAIAIMIYKLQSKRESS